MEKERIDDLGIDNLKIIQNKDYFCFGIDSVLLANFVVSNNNRNVIVDLCSGSGVIPVIISAKKKYSKIFGVELQDEMYDLLKRNISLNCLEDKIIPIHDDIKNIEKIKKMLPILLISGKADPVGGFTKGIVKLEQVYRVHGIQRVHVKFYDEMRHDVLHEEKNEEIYNYIYRWIKNNHKFDE